MSLQLRHRTIYISEAVASAKVTVPDPQTDDEVELTVGELFTVAITAVRVDLRSHLLQRHNNIVVEILEL
jgi:hypothetical protein